MRGFSDVTQGRLFTVRVPNADAGTTTLLCVKEDTPTNVNKASVLAASTLFGMREEAHFFGTEEQKDVTNLDEKALEQLCEKFGDASKLNLVDISIQNEDEVIRSWLASWVDAENIKTREFQVFAKIIRDNARIPERLSNQLRDVGSELVARNITGEDKLVG